MVKIPYPVSECIGLMTLALSPGSDFPSVKILGGSVGNSYHWVSATHVAELDSVSWTEFQTPDSSSNPGPTVVIWGSELTDGVYFFFPSASQINKIV